MGGCHNRPGQHPPNRNYNILIYDDICESRARLAHNNPRAVPTCVLRSSKLTLRFPPRGADCTNRDGARIYFGTLRTGADSARHCVARPFRYSSPTFSFIITQPNTVSDSTTQVRIILLACSPPSLLPLCLSPCARYDLLADQIASRRDGTQRGMTERSNPRG